jgi:putative oxidoreductase
MTALGPLFGVVGRILMAQIFLLSGLAKFMNGEAMAQGLVALGLPAVLIYAAAVLEVAGALALIVGYQTRLAALALSGFCVIAGILFHNQFADQVQLVMFMKNLAMAGGLLFLVRDGAGAYSLDARAAR